jgi:hypothetical protein
VLRARRNPKRLGLRTTVQRATGKSRRLARIAVSPRTVVDYFESGSERGRVIACCVTRGVMLPCPCTCGRGQGQAAHVMEMSGPVSRPCPGLFDAVEIQCSGKGSAPTPYGLWLERKLHGQPMRTRTTSRAAARATPTKTTGEIHQDATCPWPTRASRMNLRIPRERITAGINTVLYTRDRQDDRVIRRSPRLERDVHPTLTTKRQQTIRSCVWLAVPLCSDSQHALGRSGLHTIALYFSLGLKPENSVIPISRGQLHWFRLLVAVPQDAILLPPSQLCIVLCAQPKYFVTAIAIWLSAPLHAVTAAFLRGSASGSLPSLPFPPVSDLYLSAWDITVRGWTVCRLRSASTLKRPVEMGAPRDWLEATCPCGKASGSGR